MLSFKLQVSHMGCKKVLPGSLLFPVVTLSKLCPAAPSTAKKNAQTICFPSSQIVFFWSPWVHFFATTHLLQHNTVEGLGSHSELLGLMCVESCTHWHVTFWFCISLPPELQPPLPRTKPLAPCIAEHLIPCHHSGRFPADCTNQGSATNL